MSIKEIPGVENLIGKDLEMVSENSFRAGSLKGKELSFADVGGLHLVRDSFGGVHVVVDGENGLTNENVQHVVAKVDTFVKELLEVDTVKSFSIWIQQGNKSLAGHLVAPIIANYEGLRILAAQSTRDGFFKFTGVNSKDRQAFEGVFGQNPTMNMGATAFLVHPNTQGQEEVSLIVKNGRLQLPGGSAGLHITKEGVQLEAPGQVALREAQEEAGRSGEVEGMLGFLSFPGHGLAPSHNFVNLIRSSEVNPSEVLDNDGGAIQSLYDLPLKSLRENELFSDFLEGKKTSQQVEIYVQSSEKKGPLEVCDSREVAELAKMSYYWSEDTDSIVSSFVYTQEGFLKAVENKKPIYLDEKGKLSDEEVVGGTNLGVVEKKTPFKKSVFYYDIGRLLTLPVGWAPHKLVESNGFKDAVKEGKPVYLDNKGNFADNAVAGVTSLGILTQKAIYKLPEGVLEAARAYFSGGILTSSFAQRDKKEKVFMEGFFPKPDAGKPPVVGPIRLPSAKKLASDSKLFGFMGIVGKVVCLLLMFLAGVLSERGKMPSIGFKG